MFPSIIYLRDIVMKEQVLKIGVALVTVLAMLSLLCTCGASNNLHPLILIPGNGGNQLEARLTTEYKPSSFLCDRWYPLTKKKNGWFRLWFDSSVILAPFTKCFVERMTLYYHPELDDYYNAPGVDTRVPHFGSTYSLLYLNPRLKHVTEYMSRLVDSLEQLGYSDGETLFGAPYDFRYGLAAEGHPCEVGSKFLKDLRSLIENASNSNGGKPVILVSHSLGGLFVLQLLNRNPPSWRKKFIKHFVALSAPWGGAMDEMFTFASGNTLGVPLVDPLIVRSEQRSSESNLWLLPNPKVYGRQKPLVITQNRSYSAQDMVDFLKDIGFPEGVYPYETRIVPLLENIEAPEVPITCIIGTGVRTPESLFYRNSDFDERPEVLYGDGDGTVNMVSLLALQTLWKDEKNQSLKVIKIGGVSHTSILKDQVALDEIIDFDMSDAQQEHAVAIERLAPRLAALRIELCPCHMSESYFWKVYFVLLHSRLHKQDAAFLSTPQVMAARAMWMQELHKQMKPEVESFRRSAAYSRDTAQHDDFAPSLLDDAYSDDMPHQTYGYETRIADYETEKLTVESSETRFIDKSVIEENPTIKTGNMDLKCGRSSQIIIQDCDDDDDDDDWPEEDSDLGGYGGTILPLVNEEDISFSDLEDDDYGIKPASSNTGSKVL